jgi:KaiC/GvpD/RAD55 family RecA-like ATPase
LPLNIRVSLAGVVTLTEQNLVIDSMSHQRTKLSQTLDSFRDYHKQVLARNHPSDVAFLLTTEKQDYVASQSFLNGICDPDTSVGAIVYTENVEKTAIYVAHEIGHQFGVEHHDNNKACICLVEHCIMDSHHATRHFDSCSIDQIKSALNGLECLKNKPE